MVLRRVPAVCVALILLLSLGHPGTAQNSATQPELSEHLAALVKNKLGFRAGIFAKARTGVTRFYLLGITPGPNNFEQGHTRFTTDVGGVFEYYPTSNTAVRVDVGDTMVRFKTGDFFYQRLDEPMFVQRRLSHNLQINVGVALRF